MSEETTLLPPVETAPPQGGQYLPSGPMPYPGQGEQLTAGDPPAEPLRYETDYAVWRIRESLLFEARLAWRVVRPGQFIITDVS